MERWLLESMELMRSEYNSSGQEILEIQKILLQISLGPFVYSATILGLVYSKTLPWIAEAALVILSYILICIWLIISIQSTKRIKVLQEIQKNAADKIFAGNKTIAKRIENKNKYLNITDWHIIYVMHIFFLIVNSPFIIKVFL